MSKAKNKNVVNNKKTATKGVGKNRAPQKPLKKKKSCLGRCFSCLVTFAIILAILVGSGYFVGDYFSKKYFDIPMNDYISVLSDVLTFKEDKIVKSEDKFAASDLDSFYTKFKNQLFMSSEFDLKTNLQGAVASLAADAIAGNGNETALSASEEETNTETESKSNIFDNPLLANILKSENFDFKRVEDFNYNSPQDFTDFMLSDKEIAAFINSIVTDPELTSAINEMINRELALSGAELKMSVLGLRFVSEQGSYYENEQLVTGKVQKLKVILKLELGKMIGALVESQAPNFGSLAKSLSPKALYITSIIGVDHDTQPAFYVNAMTDKSLTKLYEIVKKITAATGNEMDLEEMLKKINTESIYPTLSSINDLIHFENAAEGELSLSPLDMLFGMLKSDEEGAEAPKAKDFFLTLKGMLSIKPEEIVTNPYYQSYLVDFDPTDADANPADYHNGKKIEYLLTEAAMAEAFSKGLIAKENDRYVFADHIELFRELLLDKYCISVDDVDQLIDIFTGENAMQDILDRFVADNFDRLLDDDFDGTIEMTDYMLASLVQKMISSGKLFDSDGETDPVEDISEVEETSSNDLMSKLKDLITIQQAIINQAEDESIQDTRTYLTLTVSIKLVDMLESAGVEMNQTVLDFVSGILKKQHCEELYLTVIMDITTMEKDSEGNNINEQGATTILVNNMNVAETDIMFKFIADLAGFDIGSLTNSLDDSVKPMLETMQDALALKFVPSAIEMPDLFRLIAEKMRIRVQDDTVEGGSRLMTGEEIKLALKGLIKIDPEKILERDDIDDEKIQNGDVLVNAVKITAEEYSLAQRAGLISDDGKIFNENIEILVENAQSYIALIDYSEYKKAMFFAEFEEKFAVKIASFNDLNDISDIDAFLNGSDGQQRFNSEKFEALYLDEGATGTLVLSDIALKSIMQGELNKETATSDDIMLKNISIESVKISEKFDETDGVNRHYLSVIFFLDLKAYFDKQEEEGKLDANMKLIRDLIVSDNNSKLYIAVTMDITSEKDTGIEGFVQQKTVLVLNQFADEENQEGEKTNISTDLVLEMMQSFADFGTESMTKMFDDKIKPIFSDLVETSAVKIEVVNAGIKLPTLFATIIDLMNLTVTETIDGLETTRALDESEMKTALRLIYNGKVLNKAEAEGGSRETYLSNEVEAQAAITDLNEFLMQLEQNYFLERGMFSFDDAAGLTAEQRADNSAASIDLLLGGDISNLFDSKVRTTKDAAATVYSGESMQWEGLYDNTIANARTLNAKLSDRALASIIKNKVGTTTETQVLQSSIYKNTDGDYVLELTLKANITKMLGTEGNSSNFKQIMSTEALENFFIRTTSVLVPKTRTVEGAEESYFETTMLFNNMTVAENDDFKLLLQAIYPQAVTELSSTLRDIEVNLYDCLGKLQTAMDFNYYSKTESTGGIEFMNFCAFLSKTLDMSEAEFFDGKDLTEYKNDYKTANEITGEVADNDADFREYLEDIYFNALLEVFRGLHSGDGDAPEGLLLTDLLVFNDVSALLNTDSFKLDYHFDLGAGGVVFDKVSLSDNAMGGYLTHNAGKFAKDSTNIGNADFEVLQSSAVAMTTFGQNSTAYDKILGDFYDKYIDGRVDSKGNTYTQSNKTQNDFLILTFEITFGADVSMPNAGSLMPKTLTLTSIINLTDFNKADPSDTLGSLIIINQYDALTQQIFFYLMSKAGAGANFTESNINEQLGAKTIADQLSGAVLEVNSNWAVGDSLAYLVYEGDDIPSGLKVSA